MWPARRRPNRALLPQFLELLAIIGFLALAYHGTLWYWEHTAPKAVEVPRVLKMTETEARKILEAAGLQPQVVGRKYDEEIPEGSVLSGEPPPGRKVKVGRIVRLSLSAGSRWSVVPDVREMSVDRARALLRQAKLSVGRETARYHEKVPIGYVVGQVPQPAQKVPRGTAVELWVSKGPRPHVELDRGRPAGADARSAEVSYTVPPGASLQEVRISVQDRSGERTAYRKFHQPGERIVQTIAGEGPEITIRVYLSGLLVQEKTI